tara:strand:+ start:2967 stop:3296 length:330 start_codon:yes stop_codon:yes gene_type:complete
MSKYIYVNGAVESNPTNANIGLIPIDEVLDFECEITAAPLQFVVYLGGPYETTSNQQYNIQVDNNILSDSQAKTAFDRAFSRTYFQALTDANSVTEFYPPNGVTISALV